MNNFIIDDVEYFEGQKRINELLLEQREAEKKRLYLEKLPLEPFIPSYSAYKTNARSLQSALQKYKSTLINQETIPYDICLNIISDMYGFENWDLFENTFDEYLANACNSDVVEQSIPSCSVYKIKARSLQSALQKHKVTLINQDKISYNRCLDIVSNMYGFANRQILKSSFEGNASKAYNENLIKYIKYKLHAFHEEYNENNQFFNEEYLGDKDYFISSLARLSKKLSQLYKIITDDKSIDYKVVAFIIRLVKYCFYFYYSINQSKLEQFLEDLWDSRDHDEVSKFDPISFALDELDKLENISERVKAPYPFICLIQSTRVLERNNQLEKNYQAFQHISKIIKIFVYCLSTLQTENFQSFSKDKVLREEFVFNTTLLNFEEIAEQYNLN